MTILLYRSAASNYLFDIRNGMACEILCNLAKQFCRKRLVIVLSKLSKSSRGSDYNQIIEFA